METKKISLAIFASGSGTNAENIVNYFAGHDSVVISKILTNNSDAYVLERARSLNVPTSIFSGRDLRDPSFLKELENIDFIILAGFLLLLPEYLIREFPEKIINIHPALLPKFGGKGMYGHHVHQAVIDSGEKESGITIHLVNEEYDKGKHLFKAKCEVEASDSADTLAAKIHKLEQLHFPRVIEEYILQ
ncbi:MAG: phosphoribosylglycinamide formyltransferase [Cyclobacteriaceae bacterium]